MGQGVLFFGLLLLILGWGFDLLAGWVGCAVACWVDLWLGLDCCGFDLNCSRLLCGLFLWCLGFADLWWFWNFDFVGF